MQNVVLKSCQCDVKTFAVYSCGKASVEQSKTDLSRENRKRFSVLESCEIVYRHVEKLRYGDKF